MKNKELIKKLKEYNGDAEVKVVAHCKSFPFSISYGSSEGVEKKNCDSISFYVEELCQNENSLDTSISPYKDSESYENSDMKKLDDLLLGVVKSKAGYRRKIVELKRFIDSIYGKQ
jgi:methyl coenzyme M reductase subunit D